MNKNRNEKQWVGEEMDLLDWEEEKFSMPWLWMVFSWILISGHGLFGTLLGMSHLRLGLQAATPWWFANLLIDFILFAAAVHLFLVLPLAIWVYPHYGRILGKMARLCLVTLLLSPPLASFCYFLAVDTHYFDWNELSMMVVPSVVLSALFYESTKRLWVFSLFLSVSMFIPLFVLNDQLGPYRVLIQYGTFDPYFYVLRNLLPVISIALMVGLQVFSEKQAKPFLDNFRVAIIVLSALFVGVGIAVPIMQYFGDPQNRLLASFLDPAWLVYPAMFLFLKKSDSFSFRMLGVLSVIMLAWTLGQIVHYLINVEASAWKLTLFHYHALVIVIFSWLLWMLKRGVLKEHLIQRAAE